MSTAPRPRPLSPEQYLEQGRRAAVKSEYLDGRPMAMAGASFAHNLIAANLIRALGSRLGGGPCVVLGGDQRVHVGPAGLYAYPDVVAVRGRPEFLDDRGETLLNPTPLVEVASPSTEAKYVVVAQDRMAVDRFARGDGGWLIAGTPTEPAELLRLESAGCVVPLAEVYDRVTLPGPAAGAEETAGEP